MRQEERPTLVQRWVIVTDAAGKDHLEARWVVEGELLKPVVHAA